MRVIESKISQFLVTLNLGLEWLGDAGKKLADMVDENPGCYEDIIEAAPDWLTIEVLRTLEAIGRGQVKPELLILPLHVYKRLIELPIDEQVRAIAGVELASVPRNGKPGRSGTHKTFIKPACKLSKSEADRAIGPNGIRSPREQLGAMRNQTHKSLGWIQVERFVNGDTIVKNMDQAPKGGETHRLVVNSAVFCVEFLGRI